MTPLSTPANAFSEYQSLYRDTQREILDNGLTVLIMPTSRSTGTAAAYLAVKTGAADEGHWLGAGLSHFVEHMFFKGTASRTKGQIEQDVRKMGGYINAYTSHDSTVFYITTLAEHIEEAVALLEDAAFNSVLAEEELNKEREVIVSEMRMNEDRLHRKTLLTLWNRMYSGHPYENPVIGYEDVFRSTDRNDLKRFMDRFYIPNNMVLAIAGDIDPDAVMDSVKKQFGVHPRKSLLRFLRTRPVEQTSLRTSVIRKPAEHTRVMIGYPTPKAGHPDGPALDVLAEIMGGGDDSRLYQKIKEDKGVAVDVGVFHSSLSDGGLFAIDATVKNENRQEFVGLLEDELSLLLNKGVTKQEVERAVIQLRSEYYKSNETSSSLAHEILSNEILLGDFAYAATYLEQLDGITADVVKAAAKKYVIQAKRNEVFLIPESEVSDMPQSALSEDGRQQMMKPIVKRLDNGIRLIFDPDNVNPLVQMQVVISAGTLFETDNTNGYSATVSEMVLRGTGELTQAEIARKFAAWGGSISSYSGRNSIGIGATFLKNHMDEAVKLVSELVFNPSWSEESFEKIRDELLQDLASQKEDIFTVASQEFAVALFADHPYRLNPSGSEKVLKKMTSDDVKSWYRKLLDPARMVVGFTGDLNVEAFSEFTSGHFSSIFKGGGEYLKPAENSGFEEPQTVHKYMDRQQSVLIVGAPGVDVSNQDKYALEIANAVLSGSAGRLYQKIRSEHGLSYVIGSSLLIGKLPGSFSVYCAVAPGEEEKTLRLIQDLLDSFSSGGVSELELELAKAQLTGNHQHAMEPKSSRLAMLVSEELIGSGWQSVYEYSEKIHNVSLSELNDAINRYLNPPGWTVAIVNNSGSDVS